MMEISFLKENVAFTIKEDGSIKIQASSANDIASVNILEVVKAASAHFSAIKDKVENQIQEAITNFEAKK